MDSPPEHKESLWWLTLGPAIWMAHFLACYITVALWCEKLTTQHGPLGTARWLAGGYTAIALLGIGASFWHAYRRHRRGTIPQDFDTPDARHRFLGFAGLLLNALSALAVVFVFLPFGYLATCR